MQLDGLFATARSILLKITKFLQENKMTPILNTKAKLD
jgi:hypothetical protein